MTVLLAAAPAVWSAAHAGEPWQTPETARMHDLEISRAAAWAMKNKLGDAGVTVGLAAVCVAEGPRRMEAAVLFGAFPRDHRPFRLSAGAAGGAVERFGPAVPAGPESGFHIPLITDPGEPERFVEAAFGPGSRTGSARSGTGQARRATRSSPA